MRPTSRLRSQFFSLSSRKGCPAPFEGVVGQNIDPAEAGKESGEHLLDLVAVRDVAGEKIGFPAHIADQLEGLFGVGIQFQVIDADVAPSIRQGQGDAAADAAFAASDEGFLAVE